MDSLILTAINTALEAGKVILDIYYNRTAYEIEYKHDKTPVTIADRKSHEIILKALLKTGLPVLSEEGKKITYNIRKKWKKFWLIDPLDGTKEFIKRNGEFTINIAVIENNVPVTGIIYAPVKKSLYFSDMTLGAFKSEIVEPSDEITSEQLLINSIKLPMQIKKRPFTVAASLSHINSETEKFINNLRQQIRDLEIIQIGSALKFCVIAEGNADIYPRFGPTMEWDCGAGHAIVTAAGGTLTQTDGITPLIYNKEILINDGFIVKSGNIY
ncbi:MAG: 3'(2'),5'-bisphosphate nucleotidase CysQ [Bacteroidia bacterium]|nr:3'(2'),5'-bisphosphate nucleotidase CysQ [Bacteroidia bacterium]